MTLVAGHSHVPAGKREAGLLMQRKRHRGCTERASGMAALAAVAPGVTGELPFVWVLMTIHADSELDLVLGFCTGRNVARRALYCGVRRH